MYQDRNNAHVHIHTHTHTQQKVWLQREEWFTSSGLTKIYIQTGRHGESQIHSTLPTTQNHLLTDLELDGKLFHLRLVVGVVSGHPAPGGLGGGHGFELHGGGDEVVARHLQHLLAAQQHSEQHCTRMEEHLQVRRRWGGKGKKCLLEDTAALGTTLHTGGRTPTGKKTTGWKGEKMPSGGYSSTRNHTAHRWKNTYR